MAERKITKQELVERYSSGHRDFRGLEMPEGTDLSSTNLNGIDFTGSFLTDVSFRNSALQGTIFNECNLKCSDFRGADLTGTTLRGALIEGILLDDTTVDPVALIGAIFQSSELDLNSASKFISGDLGS